MKKILRKMLFTTLLFSAVVPSEMQVSLPNWAGFGNVVNLLSRGGGSFFNFLKKHPVMVGVGTTVVLILAILKVNEKKILIFAASEGHSTLVRLLLKMGADPNMSFNGNTLLMYASVYGHCQIVSLLLDSGADINTRKHNGDTALTFALKNNNRDVVSLLFKKGTEVDLNTPLITAIENNHRGIVSLLLEKGANIDEQNEHNMPLLIKAVLRGYPKMIKLLLEKGADTNTQDQAGDTPLIHALMRWYVNRTKYLLGDTGPLLEYGDDFLKANNQRDATQSDIIVRLLLEHGANINMPNNQGVTPWELASNKPRIKEIIKNCVSQRRKEIHEALTENQQLPDDLFNLILGFVNEKLPDDLSKLIAELAEKIPQEDE